jgi:IS1 family transposase/transposase-like protein
MRKAKKWNQPCPNTTCSRYGQKNQGNIRSIASYMTQSGKRRIFECTICGEQFSETRDTVFFDLRTPEEKVMMALKMILVRVSLSNISFVLGMKEETVLEWLERAALKATAINAALLRELPVTEVQLDEMWSFVQRKVSEHAADGEQESPQEADDGRQWVWLSYAPEFRLILAAVVGPRTSETALTLIQKTARIVSGIPVFFSDGFSAYLQALIDCYHTLKTFPRTGRPGRPKNPVKEPHPDLVYGQIVKKKRKGRLVESTTRILCGAERFAELGLTISTTLLERLNLTFRQALAPLARKTLSFSKDRSHLEQQTCFFQAFYNVARPHMSLREHITVNAQRFEQKWRPRTPAMAAGLTDHVWTFRELLTVKLAHVP